MGNDRQVVLLFGPDTLKYLERKHRGGTSGAKGFRYEDYFAVYKLATLIPEDVKEGSDLHVESQLKTFVDDVIVSDRINRSKHHFQLKNSTRVSWASGDHPIKEDFRMQKALNDSQWFRGTKTSLVCSDEGLSEQLAKKIPSDISSYTTVEHFGYAETLNASLQIEPKLSDALKNLCAFADTDKIERLGVLLLGAWSAHSGNTSKVSKLWEKVLEHEPNYVKSEDELAIPTTLNQILMQIEGFSYTIESGYFVWQVTDWHMEGVLPYPVKSEQFKEFSRKIMNLNPTQIDDLEDWLV